MSVLGWIVLGLIAGFIVSKVVNRAGAGSFLDIVLGVVGALVGGWLFQLAGHTGVTLFNLYSMFVAIVGAVVMDRPVAEFAHGHHIGDHLRRVIFVSQPVKRRHASIFRQSFDGLLRIAIANDHAMVRYFDAITTSAMLSAMPKISA